MEERTPPRADIDDSLVLEMLLHLYPAHLSVDELARELDGEAASSRVRDTLGALQRAGLVHRQGDFAFAARAAVRCRELDL